MHRESVMNLLYDSSKPPARISRFNVKEDIITDEMENSKVTITYINISIIKEEVLYGRETEREKS